MYYVEEKLDNFIVFWLFLLKENKGHLSNMICDVLALVKKTT